MPDTGDWTAPDMAAIENALRLSLALSDEVRRSYESDHMVGATLVSVADQVHKALPKVLVRSWFDGSYQRALDAVLAVHQERRFDGDGYGWSLCSEDRQAWPCATVKAATNARQEDSDG